MEPQKRVMKAPTEDNQSYPLYEKTVTNECRFSYLGLPIKLGGIHIPLTMNN